ncbi:conserved hypothetical protein [Thermocrinis albus DSM 14484]|uniref:Integral membrane protein n=1 Tax=Thermocrinis albus (strain DSM 14484 / JCM 11386 / HI 11/12) TaxID=638303 RepID=D3SMX2_THEAH|nr:flippase-like domain-containing protein [Thermocrinis albus]ADC90102.1 conserved hypothetical protein [Thermocrinis albus DSM 14484]
MSRGILYGLVLTLLLILGSLFYIVKKTFTREALTILFSLDKRYLLLSIICMAFYHTFDNLRLFVLARAVKLRYSFLYGYVVSLINTFGATITPAHLGGEFMSLYTLSRKGGRLHKVLSIVTVKTATGLSFFLLAFPFFLYDLYRDIQKAKQLGLILFVAAVLMLILYRVVRWGSNRASEGGFRKRLRYGFGRYIVYLRFFLRRGKLHLLGASISSVLLYVSFLLSGAFLLKAFGSTLPTEKMLIAQISLVYAIFASPTPGGSGVGELGGLSVFEPFLEPAAVGAFVILWRFITQYMSALLGGLLLSLLLLKDYISWER